MTVGTDGTRRVTWGSGATRASAGRGCGRCRSTGRAGTGPRGGGPTRRSGRWSTDGLGRIGDVAFRVRSPVRPWQGTFADVDRAARALAGGAGRRRRRPGGRRPVPAPELGRGRHHLLGRRLPGRGRRPRRALLRAPRRSSTSWRPRTRRWSSPPTASATTTSWPPTPRSWRVDPGRGGWWSGETPDVDLPSRAQPLRVAPGGRSPRRPGARRPRRAGRSSASPRARPGTRRASSTPTARSGARPASSTTCSPRADRP